MKELTVLKDSKGIHSRISQVKSPYDIDNGFAFLAAAVNVDITDGNRITRRKGYDSVITADIHSIFFYEGNCFCVLDGNLVKVFPSLAYKVVRTGMPPAKVRYAGVGDKLFYSNNIVNGFIHEETDYIWAPGSYHGPDTVAEYVAPPVCKHLAYHLGRIYMSIGSAVFYTAALNYLAVNKSENFLSFNSDVRMLLSVGNVLYIADQTNIYAYKGTDPDNFEVISVLSDVMIEGTDLLMHSPILLGKLIPGAVGMFTSQNAIYAALPDGSLFDIAESRLCFPYSNTGNAYIDNNIYTVLIDE